LYSGTLQTIKIPSKSPEARYFEVGSKDRHNTSAIVMEYLEKGDLLSYLKKAGVMSEKEAKAAFMQILYGLAHIHC